MHSLRDLDTGSTRALMISRRNVCFYSHVDPHLSNYCLAVTSGSQPHPSTLCAAQNVLKAHPHPVSRTASKEHHHRGIPEGLHCVRQTKLTLHRMRYDTTYNFTLYVVGLSLNRVFFLNRIDRLWNRANRFWQKQNILERNIFPIFVLILTRK